MSSGCRPLFFFLFAAVILAVFAKTLLNVGQRTDGLDSSIFKNLKEQRIEECEAYAKSKFDICVGSEHCGRFMDYRCVNSTVSEDPESTERQLLDVLSEYMENLIPFTQDALQATQQKWNYSAEFSIVDKVGNMVRSYSTASSPVPSVTPAETATTSKTSSTKSNKTNVLPSSAKSTVLTNEEDGNARDHTALFVLVIVVIFIFILIIL